MRRIAFSAAVSCLVSFLSCSLAQAQTFRAWVSAFGDDLSPTCSLIAPCKTFAGAISKVTTGGEINCLNAAGYGQLTIAKSITVDCREVYGSVQATSGAGITVNGMGTAIKVTLRNLNISGNGVGTRGINIIGAGEVHIEDVMITGFTQQAIADVRPAGFSNILSVKNSTLRNNGGAGISAAAIGNSSTIIDNLHSVSNGYGVAVATGNKVIINRSIMSANITAGVQGDSGSQVAVNNSVVSYNPSGVNTSGTTWLTNTSIAYNSTAITGATTSFGTNRIYGNTAAGTTPTVGAASSDHSQQ
jgi:hypothetical protein